MFGLKKIEEIIENKKMSLQEKIEYLTYLKSEGIDLKNIDKNYVYQNKIRVSKVIENIYKYYNEDKMTIKQIIQCENIGLNFEEKYNTKIQIEFIKKALDEGILIKDIVTEEQYSSSLILKYIKAIREKYLNNELNEKEIDICLNEIKILFDPNKKKNVVLNVIKASILKNIYKFC